MSEGQPIEVVATERGYYNDHLQEPGEAFTVEDHRDFSFRWMEPVKNDAKTKKLLAEAEAHQEAERAARIGQAGAGVEMLLDENAELKARIAELEKG